MAELEAQPLALSGSYYHRNSSYSSPANAFSDRITTTQAPNYIIINKKSQ